MVKKRRRPEQRKKQGSYYFYYLFALLGMIVLWLGSNSQWLSVSPLQRLSHQAFVVEEKFVEEANQHISDRGHDIPLILQTDERWYYEAYGTNDSDNFMGNNGCALASLAMVGSYWQNRLIEPVEILSWAQNNYYLTGQGTMWSIFNDYAHAIGMISQDLGNDFATAKQFMMLGYPVLVSVKPGDFTEVGHIMVLMADEKGEVFVFDPNDSPTKQHYAKTYTDDLILAQAINYWVFQ